MPEAFGNSGPRRPVQDFLATAARLSSPLTMIPMPTNRDAAGATVVTPIEDSTETRQRGWPRCPECDEWAVPKDEWPHPSYAWSCPQNPATGPFTMEITEGRHEWYRLTDNREVQEAERIPDAPPASMTPEDFYCGVLQRTWKRLKGAVTPFRHAGLNGERTNRWRRTAAKKPDVRRCRVYARDLILGDLVVAQWRDGVRITRGCGWRVTKIKKMGGYYLVRRDDHFSHSHHPYQLFSIDREM